MKLVKLVFSVTLLSLFFSSQNFAQETPIEWGKISRPDLEMKSFAPDTNASAIILCDYGESYFDENLVLVFKRHQRIKILTTKGYEFGTYSLVLYTHDDAEMIDDIEGVTYYLDEKNNVVEKELDSDDIFEEEVDEDYTRYRFTMPSLRPGCIIEVRYKIETESIYRMRDWVFQKSEPVLWSEYRVTHPKTFSYATVTIGYEPYAVEEETELTQVFSTSVESYLGERIAKCSRKRWVAKNLPAIRDEAYITTTNDYLNKIDIQLSGYIYSGMAKKVWNDWNTVVKELLDSDYFGEKIETTSQIEKLAQSLTQNVTTDVDKIKVLYDWVTSSIVWNEFNRVYAYQTVDETIKTKKGNSAEINFLLISLLREAGINADPVILSTRSNGKIQNLYPIVSQFNYVIARAKIGTNFYYLDAVDPLRPFDLPGNNILNVAGFVIKKSGPEWINIISPKRAVNSASSEIELSEDGTLQGKIEDTFSEYSALGIRKKSKDKKEIDLAKEIFESEQAGITIDSLNISGIDSISSPLKINAVISSSNYAQSNGNLIYFNPHIINRTKNNPFKTNNRKFPIDFGHKYDITMNFKIKLPDNYEVKSKIDDVLLSVGGGALNYVRRVQVNDNIITVNCKFDVREIEIKPKFYQQVREFYSKLVSSQADQFVFSKKSAASTTIKN